MENVFSFFFRRMNEMMEFSCKSSEATEKKARSRTPKAARTQRTSHQNSLSGSDPGHENQTEPDVKPRRRDQDTAELENHHTDATKRRHHKRRRNKQALGGAETGTAADHLTHTAQNQQQKKHNPNQLNTSTDTATPPLIDDSTAPDDGGEEKQKRRKKKKKKKCRGNTEDKPVKLCESGAVEKPNTPLKNTQAQGEV